MLTIEEKFQNLISSGHISDHVLNNILQEMDSKARNDASKEIECLSLAPGHMTVVFNFKHDAERDKAISEEARQFLLKHRK